MEEKIKVGNKFSESYPGYTMTGYGRIEHEWKITKIEKDYCVCRLSYTNECENNGKYFKKIDTCEILKFMK